MIRAGSVPQGGYAERPRARPSKYLSPPNRHRLAMRSLEHDENVAKRLRRQLYRARPWCVDCISRKSGESLAIVMHSSDGRDFSFVRVIGIYCNGTIQQRIAPVTISGTRYIDPQSSHAELTRVHAETMKLAADLRQLGKYTDAREAIARASRWRHRT